MRSSLVAFGIAALVALVGTRDAHAETSYVVKVTGTTITVTPRAGWHINEEFPWKLTAPGRPPVDRSKFTFTEVEAVLRDAPTGVGTLKGAVCSADKCEPFAVQVTVP